MIKILKIQKKQKPKTKIQKNINTKIKILKNTKETKSKDSKVHHHKENDKDTKNTKETKTNHVTLGIEYAKDLPKLDILSESDPYVTIHVEDDEGERELGRTKTIDNNDNPVWNEYFVIDIHKLKRIWINVWDEDIATPDFIGSVDLDPASALENYTLKKRVLS